jgi:hypothetical protein
MTTVAAGNKRVRGRLRTAFAAVGILVLLLVVPPLININHYRGRITELISESLGRPVRLSSAQVRLLPWPAFEISNLSVAEDPAYGAEPVLHASSVVASIRLLELLRGRVEIGKISVDNASLNLVRAGRGKWNLDPLFRTAAEKAEPASGARRRPQLPYLEATNSRIDFKNGVEKLPFSLVDADLSFWQENPGEWRIRVRAQPARTDVSMYQEETGVVRIEASVRRAPSLSQMPLQVDIDWRQAQLGQLARIITGTDPGWRGDLTGELHLNGTADSAQVTMRLRASGVHRAEFTPASPLDFDANCAFKYHYAQRSLENLACNSPIGDGSVHMTGEVPGENVPPQFSLALDRVPVDAGLDALRTLRKGLAPDLDAKGTVSGNIVYAVPTAASAQPAKPVKTAGKHDGKIASEVTGPLTGKLIVSNFVVSGGGLTRPLAAPKTTLEPVTAAQGSSPALAGTVTIPAGGAVPLTLNLRLGISGYRVGVGGQASVARGREIARAAGIPGTDVLASLAGEPIAVDLTATGPWLAPEQFSLVNGASSASAPVSSQPQSVETPGSASTEVPVTDRITGTVTLRNANWKADYLANHLLISEATLHLDNGNLSWDPVAFTYGLLKGTASVAIPSDCPADQAEPQAATQAANQLASQTANQGKSPACHAQFQIHFGDLDAGALETALLGAHEKGTLLSDLIDRFDPAKAPAWPQLEGTLTADSLALGAVNLEHVSAVMRILPASAEITSLDGSLLGGDVHATGSLLKPATIQDKPSYAFEGDFEKLNAGDVGRLLGLRWTGQPLSGNGKVELAGYTDRDLGASAKGTIHAESREGAIAALRQAPAGKIAAAGNVAKPVPMPVALGRFDHLTADATIANGGMKAQVGTGAKKRLVEATITFGEPAKVSFAASREAKAGKR